MAPTQSGEYHLQQDTVTWDGSQYRFAWIDRDNSVKWAQGDDVQLVQDERTFLEMRDGKPIIHLTADTPVTVLARDRGGDFSSFMAAVRGRHDDRPADREQSAGLPLPAD